MENIKLKKVLACCLVCISILMPTFSLATRPDFPNELRNTHPSGSKCTEPMKKVGTPSIKTKGPKDSGWNNDYHVLNVWTCKYQCPKCKKTFNYTPEELEKHTYPTTGTLVASNQTVTYSEVLVLEGQCKINFYGQHIHYQLTNADIYSYRCKKCGHEKEESKNLRIAGHVHNKPKKVRKLKK